MRSASMDSSSQRSRSDGEAAAGSAGGASSSSYKNVNDPCDDETERNPLLLPRHKPLGSAERSVEDRQLNEMMQYELQRKALQRLQQTCPFRPHINTSAALKQQQLPQQQTRQPLSQVAQPNDHSGSSSSGVRNDMPVEQRLLQKARTSALIKKEREAAKKRQEEQTMQQLFKPQLNHDDPYRQKLLHPPDLPVEERLLHYGKTIEESRKHIREDRELQEQKQMLEFFRPSTTSTSQFRKQQQSFLTRAETRLNDRDKAVGEARAMQAKEYTFHPSISRLSQHLAQEQRRAQHDTDRAKQLHEEAEKRRREREQKEQEQAALEADRRAYHPTTNPSSEHWIRRGQHRDLFTQKDFVHRQEEYQRVHEEHSEELRRAREEQERGQIDAAKPSLHLNRVKHGMIIEEQVERLYREARDVSNEVKERLKEQLLREECPFTPQISLVAQRVYQEKDVVKRLTTPKYKPPNRSHSAPPPAQSSSNDNSSSFVVSHVTPSGHSGRQVRPSEAAEFYQRQVDSVQRTHGLLQLKQSERHLHEQLECTFRPKTNARPSTPQNQSRLQGPGKAKRSASVDDRSSSKDDAASVVNSVVGVSEFLKRRELAQKLIEERAKRVESLGKGLPCNGPNFTVVVPFHLSNRKPVLRSSSHDGLSTTLRNKKVASGRHHSPDSDQAGQQSARWKVDEAIEASVLISPSKRAHANRTRGSKGAAATYGSAARYDDRVPRPGHTDPYNSERLLAAIQRYAT